MVSSAQSSARAELQETIELLTTETAAAGMAKAEVAAMATRANEEFETLKEELLVRNANVGYNVDLARVSTPTTT